MEDQSVGAGGRLGGGTCGMTRSDNRIRTPRGPDGWRAFGAIGCRVVRRVRGVVRGGSIGS
jgi:hypothetical protein